jgi:photosystem II stability/assembly factor-like uncharacterized protein
MPSPVSSTDSATSADLGDEVAEIVTLPPAGVCRNAGSVAISTDAGQTWKTELATVTSGQAISAGRDNSGVLEILVVTDTGVLQSRDDGATLSELKS